MPDPIAISADCHVTEPLDLWSRELPAAMRSRGPRIEVHDGRAGFAVEDRLVRKLPPLPSGALTTQAATAFWSPDDAHSRLRALDQDGVWAEVMYPNLAFFCVHEIRDPELQVATCKIYNDWVRSAFGGEARIAPVGLLPSGDLEACVRELERLHSLGLKAAMLPAHSDRQPYNDPAWERLWESAAGLRVPLSFHAGTGRSQTPVHGPGAAVVNYVVTVSGPMETVSYLCAAGILERHPQLRVGMVECGAGWLAWTLEAMDDAYREHHAWVRPKLRDLPSDSFRRQGFVTFQRDPVGIANLERTGAACLMWGSDYPHPEGTFPESRRVIAEQIAELDPTTAERIVCRNAAEVYGIELPSSSAVAECDEAVS